MKEEKYIEERIDQLISEERGITPNPYLSSRVMATIARQQERESHPARYILKPVLALASLVLVVWLGILAGNAYTSGSNENATELLNDATSEHFAFYQQNENED